MSVGFGTRILATSLVVLICCFAGSCTREAAPKADTAYGRGGDHLWLPVPGGRLKAEAYSSAQVSAHPVLLVVLHGDLFDPTPSYQYAFAQLVTQGTNAPVLPASIHAMLANWKPIPDTVAVGILRPGYTDNSGDRSDGVRGNAADDNYTPEVVDAVASAIEDLKQRFKPRRVVLVGHSGGAAIEANLLGRHPEAADAALLVACGCDPNADRAYMRTVRKSSIWRGRTRSLQPLELAPHVRRDVIVRLIVGENDHTGNPQYSIEYADALKSRGINAQVTIVPGVGHNILLTEPVLGALAQLLRAG